MNDKCAVDPERRCDVQQRVVLVEQELNDLRRQNAGTHERFGERIGELESHNKVQDVEVKNLQKSIDSMSGDVKEVMSEAKDMSRKLPVIMTKLDAISESNKAVDADVDELKEKPGKRWEATVGQIIGLVVAALVGLLLARLGLS